MNIGRRLFKNNNPAQGNEQTLLTTVISIFRYHSHTQKTRHTFQTIYE